MDALCLKPFLDVYESLVKQVTGSIPGLEVGFVVDKVALPFAAI
jgi:hypothetical protein